VKESPGEHWRHITSQHGKPHDFRTAWDHDESSTAEKWGALAALVVLAALLGFSAWAIWSVAHS